LIGGCCAEAGAVANDVASTIASDAAALTLQSLVVRLALSMVYSFAPRGR
jgi:hypothetical protein